MTAGRPATGGGRPRAVSPAARDGRRRWLRLVTLSVAVSLIMVDGTIVNVALPTVIGDLRLSATDAEWVNAAYMLVFAAFLLPAGRFGDVLGHRVLLAGGVTVFVGASVLAGMAGGAPSLLAGRVLQGAGAAVILPSTLAILNSAFRGRDRATAFAVWGSAIGATVALGPVLGGWLTSAYSWRWVFAINVPLGVLVVAGVLLWLPESRDPRATLRMGPAGVLCASLGFAALVFSLIEGQRYGWWTPLRPFRLLGTRWPFSAVSPIPVAAAFGVVCVGVFVVASERRRRRRLPVLLDLTLFAVPGFRIGNLAIAVVGLAEFGLVFVLPLYLQAVLGLSALRAGLVILALAVGSLAAGPVAGTATHKYGARTVVVAGLALETAGIAVVAALLGPSTSPWALVPPLFVYGAGIGLASAQLSNIVLADVPVERSGQASGAQSTTRLLGSALGIAVLGAALAGTLALHLDRRLAGFPAGDRDRVAQPVRESLGAELPRLAAAPGTARAAHAARGALSDATRDVTAVTAALMLGGLLAGLRLPRDRRTRKTESQSE